MGIVNFRGRLKVFWQPLRSTYHSRNTPNVSLCPSFHPPPFIFLLHFIRPNLFTCRPPFNITTQDTIAEITLWLALVTVIEMITCTPFRVHLHRPLQPSNPGRQPSMIIRRTDLSLSESKLGHQKVFHGDQSMVGRPIARMGKVAKSF